MTRGSFLVAVVTENLEFIQFGQSAGFLPGPDGVIAGFGWVDAVKSQAVSAIAFGAAFTLKEGVAATGDPLALVGFDVGAALFGH
jgi:hypothetical protein